jgi:biotin carboxylase
LKNINNLIILHSDEAEFDFPNDVFEDAIICNFEDEKDLMSTIDCIYNKYKFKSVVNLTEKYVILAANIRTKYELRGMKKDQSIYFRDKYRMKDKLKKLGIRTPLFNRVRSLEDIKKFIMINGKCVIKPIDGSGSKLTYVVDQDSDLHFLSELEIGLEKLIIEEFIEGEMYHCDSIIQNDEILLCSISKYNRPPMKYNDGNNLSSVMISNSKLKRDIEKQNELILKMLELNDGVSHLEFFVTEHSQLIFCEVAARAGGSGIIPSIEAAYGINMFEADIKAQLGKPIQIDKGKTTYSGWLIIVGKPGKIKKISEAKEFNYSWISYKSVNNKCYDILSETQSSTQSVAEFTIIGESEEDVLKKIKLIEDRFSLVIENN